METAVTSPWFDVEGMAGRSHKPQQTAWNVSQFS